MRLGAVARRPPNWALSGQHRSCPVLNRHPGLPGNQACAIVAAAGRPHKASSHESPCPIVVAAGPQVPHGGLSPLSPADIHLPHSTCTANCPCHRRDCCHCCSGHQDRCCPLLLLQQQHRRGAAAAGRQAAAEQGANHEAPRPRQVTHGPSPIHTPIHP